MASCFIIQQWCCFTLHAAPSWHSVITVPTTPQHSTPRYETLQSLRFHFSYLTNYNIYIISMVSGQSAANAPGVTLWFIIYGNFSLFFCRPLRRGSPRSCEYSLHLTIFEDSLYSRQRRQKSQPDGSVWFSTKWILSYLTLGICRMKRRARRAGSASKSSFLWPTSLFITANDSGDRSYSAFCFSR